MRILALDLSGRIGWARGKAGSKPEVGVFELREGGERIEEAIPRLGVWLVGLDRLGAVAQWLVSDRVAAERHRGMLEDADFVVVEPYVPVSAATKFFTNADAQEAGILLNGAVRMACGLWGVPVRAPPTSTVRVHFCGRMSAAPKRPVGYKRTAEEQRKDRAATKLMVVRRAQELGLIGRDCYDEDIADACALYSFASSYWGKAEASFQLTETRV